MKCQMKYEMPKEIWNEMKCQMKYEMPDEILKWNMKCQIEYEMKYEMPDKIVKWNEIPGEIWNAK